VARNLLAYPFQPYNGAYSSEAVNDGRGAQKGLSVRLDLVWKTYSANAAPLGSSNPNFAVAFNLNVAGPSTVSGTWTVQSVYVDNEGVDFPVYVYFSDSQQAVSAPANSAGWYPVLTNQRQGLVTAIGITDSAIAANQITKVFFTDVFMVPSLDQEVQSAVALWIGSTLIQRTQTNLSGYGAPALGDQILQTSIDVSGSGLHIVPIPQFTSPNLGDVLYITRLQAWVCNLTSNNAGAAPNGVCNVSYAGQPTNQAFGIPFNGPITAGQITQSFIAYDMTGNFRFPANLTWSLGLLSETNIASGAMFVNIAYTISSH